MALDAAQFVGSIPENYDKGLGPRIFTGYADDLTRRVAGLNPGSVLELAAGTGILSRKLRDALPDDCDLTVSDLNPPMLEVAKQKFRPDEPVKFETIDAMDLKFAEARFDVVLCQFGVMFFPDKGRSYAEVCRVLKPGGSYLFNVWDTWQKNPFARITHEVVEAFFPENPPGFYKVPFGYNNAKEIEESLLKAGFSRVTIEHLAIKSAIPSAADFAKGLVFGNPVYDEVVTRGGNPDKLCTAVADAIDRQLGQEMPLQALIVHATKT
jgi:ubiquinone/menaquinone biosynthesis C-methylase UbiE